jgi:hypothetical protein
VTTVSPPEFLDGYQVTACSAATCGAPIIWAHSATGSRTPLDAQPSPNGSVELYRDSAGNPRSRVIPKAERAARSDLRTSHFATCNRADAFRRTR